MRASGINRAFMQARSLARGPLIAASSAAGMPSGSEGNAQLASSACAIALPASAPARIGAENSIRSIFFSLLDDLRHKRGRRHLDFPAGDADRGATNTDRGHDASALTRLRFDFASAPHRNTLLDRKAIGRPVKIMLRCHDADEGGTGAARRGIFFDAKRGCPHACIELAAIL